MSEQGKLHENIVIELEAISSEQKSRDLQRFFKTGPGQYGEGDQFMGIGNPDQQKVAAKYWKECGEALLQKLLNSPWHEQRQTALYIMIRQFEKPAHSPLSQEQVYGIYTGHFNQINNWDLVDVSAPKIPGPWLYHRDQTILRQWAASSHLWTQRIAVLSSFYFIRQGDFEMTLKLAEDLLAHPHDLIHKAVGWMLREIGKRDLKTESDFLRQYYKVMPRTMLRYAIERYPEAERRKWLKGDI